MINNDLNFINHISYCDYLKTVAGSTLRILLKANDAPLKEIRPIVANMTSTINGENEKIKPDRSTPLLNPSSNNKPIKKPTIEKSKAWVRISRLIYLFPAPIAFKVP